MDHWKYETADDLDQPMLERLRNFPRQPDMLVYGARLAAAASMRAWLALYHRLRVVGRENLPAAGSFILVANHSSHLDTVCLLSALPLAKVHRTFPAAASDYFFVSVPRMALAAIAVNALPFDRRIRLRQSLGLCRELLANAGNVLVIFPEGTRATTGKVGTFKPGVGMLAAGTSYPIVPCYLDGAHRALPKGALLPRPRRIRLTIGRAMDFSHLSPGKASAEQVCRTLRDAVLALGGENEASATTTSAEARHEHNADSPTERAYHDAVGRH